MLEWKSQEKAITQEEEGACKFCKTAKNAGMPLT